jgi:hypothetical protein
MAFIDRRVSLRKAALAEPLSLAVLVAHAARCPDCEPFGVEDLGPTRRIRQVDGLVNHCGTQPEERLPFLLRTVPSLKNRLAAYAWARGLTLNAAAVVLLDQALGEAEGPDLRLPALS